jgi:tetratricopeptide (TPR) repeat protein
MNIYSARDVERVLRLPRSTLRGLVNAGFVTPGRGPRREYRFSFQDLIVLRTARALMDAKVPRRRINRALDDLRRHLPETVPLSGLSICAVGERVVVRDGKSHWQVDDGQYLLGLDISIENGSLRVIDRKLTAEHTTEIQQEDWFVKAMELETTHPEQALDAYERATSAHPQEIGAWVNWGCLLHERGDSRAAEDVYKRGLREAGANATLYFNLGVLLEDAHRNTEAIDAYQSAIEEDPTLADAHYNLARLYESAGKPQHAIRHLGEYRRLVRR